MRSFSPTHLEHLSFSTDEVAALTALGAARGRQQLYIHQQPEVLESLRQAAVIESSESSNRLEGITVPRERIEALVLRPTQPRDRSEQEIAGYRDALTLIHESRDYMPFTVNVLLQLHTLVYRYHPNPGGRFKPTDNDIVERSADGNVGWIAAWWLEQGAGLDQPEIAQLLLANVPQVCRWCRRVRRAPMGSTLETWASALRNGHFELVSQSAIGKS